MVSRHQLRSAIEIIEQATSEGFSEITQELDSAVQKVKLELANTDQKHRLLSDDIGKAQTLYGFDENYFKNYKTVHSYTVQNFIKDWMIKQAEWRYPLCVLSPSNPNYTELCLASNLVYVLTNNFTANDIKSYIAKKLKKGKTFNPSMFRQKPLNHTGIIENKHVPFNQVGTILSNDYFSYISIEQIKNFLTSFAKILRPGGEAMIHITDADCEPEWKSVVGKKVTYCTIKIIQDLCVQCGLEFRNYYHVDSMYTYVNIAKQGNLSTIKKQATKIEQVR
jgi:hypothetical protein